MKKVSLTESLTKMQMVALKRRCKEFEFGNVCTCDQRIMYKDVNENKIKTYCYKEINWRITANENYLFEKSFTSYFLLIVFFHFGMYTCEKIYLSLVMHLYLILILFVVNIFWNNDAKYFLNLSFFLWLRNFCFSYISNKHFLLCF